MVIVWHVRFEYMRFDLEIGVGRVKRLATLSVSQAKACTVGRESVTVGVGRFRKVSP